MALEKKFIVAVELGSSKITGIAGRKNLDGSISVLAVVQENSSSCIRRGVVYNIDKTTQALVSIKKRLETLLQTKIVQVYVGVGGQSIYGVRNVIVRDLQTETIVDHALVNELMDANRAMNYPDQEILDAIVQEYKVDSQLQTDPVGIQCTRLEANFLNILWRKTFYRNLNNCFEKAGINIAEMYLAPLALADSVLTEAERRAGCMLVDLGAETTTMSVYYKNVLRQLVVIPLGGANITRDIASEQMEESEAENLKLKYGCAYTDNAEIDSSQMLPINAERGIENQKFIEIVEARLTEIIYNVWQQMPEEYIDKLFGGIVITGGGANMRDIDKAFRVSTRVDKIRLAKTVTQTIDATQLEITSRDCRMCTALGLLAKGDMNCAGAEITGNLFDSADENESDGQQQGNSPTGRVMTEANKREAEEKERRRREQEELLRQQAEEAQKEEERQKEKENNFWNKLWHKVKEFAKSTITEDE